MNAQSLSYFDAYEGFTPKPHETVEKEFNRLANIRGWIAGTKKYHQEHRRCLYSEFDTHVGMIVVDDNLNSWQSLCLEVGVSTIPGSITQCKKVHTYTLALRQLLRGIQKLIWLPLGRH